MAGRQYMILRPDKAGWSDILKLLFFRRSGVDRCKCVETDFEAAGVVDSWVVAATLLIQKVLLKIYKPFLFLGNLIEYLLNLIHLNGGFLSLLRRIFTFSVVIPKRDSADYRSVIGHIDGRVQLHKNTSLINFFSMIDPQAALNDVNYLDLSMMAAKLAYENPAFIKDAVNNHLKMNFVQFFNCWNKFVEDYTTQAFILSDRPSDANLIVLAFRGTESFNARDWSTDVDLSWLCLGKLGNIHVGFLKALGLQDDKDCTKALPKDLPNDMKDPSKPFAYYAIRDTLRSLVDSHPKARIVVTGHSLGGALAAIFPGLLAMHDEHDILDRMYGSMTYGQPRVGDAVFAAYMANYVQIKHYRMVYRYDIVPRIPFDAGDIARFKHFGTCIFYDGWYSGEVVVDSPNPNYFDPLYLLFMYACAWIDLIKALLMVVTEGEEFVENYVSILYRMSGLLFPGIACHSPRDYVNGGRLSKISHKIISIIRNKFFT